MRVGISAHGIEHQGTVGIGQRQRPVEVVRCFVRQNTHGLLEISRREVPVLFHLNIQRPAFGVGEQACLARIAGCDLHVGELHPPAVAAEFDAIHAGHLGQLLRFVLRLLFIARLGLYGLIHPLERDGAAGNDAVVKARHELAEEQAPGAE